MRIAQRRAAAVPDVKRAGGIGGDELDVDPVAAADRRCDRRRRPGREWSRASAESSSAASQKLMKPGPGDLHLRDDRARELDLLDHPAGEIARFLLELLGEHHGEIGRQVAVTLVPRPLQHEARPVASQHLGDALQLLPNEIAHSPAFFFGAYGIWPGSSRSSRRPWEQAGPLTRPRFRLGACLSALSDLSARSAPRFRSGQACPPRPPCPLAPLPVLPVVGDVKPEPLKTRSGPARDLPGGHFPA